jgi:exodeoxyribonuclease V alpha subunit
MPPSLRHYTSRAGDPHRHRHLQINARVRAGGWRGLLSVGVRESLEAINGIGHPAAMTDPGSRRALVAHGYTLDPESGEVRELAAHAGAFRRTGPQDRPARSSRTSTPVRPGGAATIPARSRRRLRQAWNRRARADERMWCTAAVRVSLGERLTIELRVDTRAHAEC